MTQPTPPAIPPLPPSEAEAALRRAIAMPAEKAPARPLSRRAAAVWGW